METNWGLLDTGYHSAAINMAFDECLLNWQSEGKIPPTLRFYGWNKPSLSIGYFQRAKTINFEGIRKHDCEFVRRLTGGSAVLHADELTYSLVISENDPDIPKSVTKAYYVLTQGVLEGYKNLGIDADFAIPERELDNDRSAICFEKPSFYEMLVDGKKICGTARRQKRVSSCNTDHYQSRWIMICFLIYLPSHLKKCANGERSDLQKKQQQFKK